MRTIVVSSLLLMALLMPTPTSGATAEAEYITVPAQGIARVENENFAAARRTALRNAFRSAARHAVAGLIPPATFREQTTKIEQHILSRGEELVHSYKFLGESISQSRKQLTVSLQVTLFLDTLRARLKEANVLVKKSNMPTLMIIIDERSMAFFQSDNFLLLDSLSEEVVARLFRERGYQVYDRETLRNLRADDAILAAMDNDPAAFDTLAERIETDLFLFGTTDVTVEPDEAGEQITARITVRLLSGDGTLLTAYSTNATTVTTDTLKGSIGSIRAAATAVAREMALQTPRIWKEQKRARALLEKPE